MSTLRNIHREIEYHMRSFIWDFLFLRLGQILKPNSDNVESLYREKKKKFGLLEISNKQLFT